MSARGGPGRAARECPGWSRQATYGPGNTAADPLEAARSVTVGHVTPGERRGRPLRACSSLPAVVRATHSCCGSTPSMDANYF